MIYLSGSYHTIPEAHRHLFGYMLNAMTMMSHESKAVEHTWMLDNGAYSGKWNELTWRRRMSALGAHSSRCIAAVVPDVVFDAQATLHLWRKYAKVAKHYGYRTAFVTQNGLDIRDVPWDELDVLMIGGDHRHKMQSAALRLMAREKGKWVHVARVNSVEKMMLYRDADSVDGNHFLYNMRQGEMKRWIMWLTTLRKGDAAL